MAGGANANTVVIADTQCAISFDRATGAVADIRNIPLDDPILKPGGAFPAPFRIHADFPGEWLLDSDPEAAAHIHLSPADMTLCSLSADESGRSVTAVYESAGIECVLTVALQADAGESQWSLSVRNAGAASRSLIVEFPRLDGVRLGPAGSQNLATVLRGAGYTDEADSHVGGVYGNGGEWSMQWHAIYDPASRSALGLIVEDPEIINKMLLPASESLAVRYFPPRALSPGEALNLPPASLLVYGGDWKRTARRYRRWYLKAFALVEPPRWFRETDAYDGRHFKKRVPGGQPDHGGQFYLDTFREIPAAHLPMPIDHVEYAFWSHGSMYHNIHTDGDNIVRDDMGGPAAMRDGIAGLHDLGLHASLYIEGYIVHESSNLAVEGKARKWSVMHRDGSITGNYTREGFYHMCPGCVEWQDHLVEVTGRVLGQTGADGIRLDSLGFYFLPCYNPAHEHESPFGYNRWIGDLLAKVRAAALAANPQALLTTEAPVDYYGQWFNGALVFEYPRDIPPMRLAIGTYQPFNYSPSGPVWGSLSGYSGGRSGSSLEVDGLEASWLCAQPTILDALVRGDVADEDPPASDPAIVTRLYRSASHDAVVAVRPEHEGPRWPNGSMLAQRHAPYTVRIPVEGKGKIPVAFCDLEHFAWSRLSLSPRGGSVEIETKSNWLLAVLPHAGVQVVGFDPLPDARQGDEVEVAVKAIAGNGETRSVTLWAPGLEVGGKGGANAPVPIGGTVTVRVPMGALPGLYQIRVRGEAVLGIKRLLRVTDAAGDPA